LKQRVFLPMIVR